jgi:hypothetical protein
MVKIFTTIKERILFYIESQNIIKANFFKKTDIAASNFKGSGLKSEIGGDKIVKILSEYPDLNPEWLLTGEGEMLKNPNGNGNQSIVGNNSIQGNITGNNKIQQGNNADYPLETLRSLLQEKDKRIKEKDEQLQAKDKQLQAKDEQLQAKDEQINKLLSILYNTKLET